MREKQNWGPMESRKDKPAFCYESGCPLAEKGRGFVLGVGDPARAKIAMILEAPGRDEIAFGLTPVDGREFFSTQAQCSAEIERRRKDYPDVPLSMLTRGVPVVGASGAELNQWAFPAAGLKRDELFIDNTIRCLPPPSKTGAPYPTGDDRKAAEKACRHYDRLDKFKPDIAVITMHPAGILREVTPLPLQIKDLEKARDFVAAGKRVMVLLGGKAAKAFARFGENVTKVRGAYRWLPKDWLATYKSEFEYQSSGAKRAATTAKKRAKKVVDEIEALFGGAGDGLKRPKRARKKKEKKNGD